MTARVEGDGNALPIEPTPSRMGAAMRHSQRRIVSSIASVWIVQSDAMYLECLQNLLEIP